MVLLRKNKNHTICTPTASHLLAVEKQKINVQKSWRKEVI